MIGKGDPLGNGVSWWAQIACVFLLDALAVHIVVSEEGEGTQDSRSVRDCVLNEGTSVWLLFSR